MNNFNQPYLEKYTGKASRHKCPKCNDPHSFAYYLDGNTGETPKKERERVLEGFKAGGIKVVANAGVLICGFDYPELDTVVLASPTMSLAQYYQKVGRVIRPHPSKDTSWVIDLCGNINRFGEVKDLRMVDSGNGKWAVYSKSRQLTNTYF